MSCEQSYYRALIWIHTYYMNGNMFGWPWLTSKRVAPFVSDSWVSCLLTQHWTIILNNANTAACRSATKPQCECDEGGNDAKHCNVSWSRISLNQSWQCVSGSWVRDQMGQQIWVGHVGHMTRWPILYCTHPISHVIFLVHQQRQWNLLLWYIWYIFTTAVTTWPEQRVSETHRFPWEGPNSVEILGKKD